MSETELQELVVERADSRCEYCRMHQALQGATFHVEHIVPRCKGGLTSLDNLALACPSCNLLKADRVRATDPLTNQLVAPYHPRENSWSEHFAWNGVVLLGLSAVGRAAIHRYSLTAHVDSRFERPRDCSGCFRTSDPAVN
jgi:hypothetical protein